MIPTKIADKIVTDLKGVDGYPDNSWLRSQMSRVLTEASSETHARAAVERCLAESHWCPDVPSIVQALNETPRTQHLSGCDRCEGAGWYHVETGGPGTMVCCDCPAGVARRLVLKGAP